MPNAKVLEAKKAVVAELTEKLQNAASGVLVDYKGITVAEDTALRNELRKNEVEYAVVKNTLTRFAVEGAGLGELGECLNGTTSLAISHNDPIAPMRVINKFAKQFNGAKFTIKAGFMDGKILPLDEILAIAELPAKEVACQGGPAGPGSGYHAGPHHQPGHRAQGYRRGEGRLRRGRCRARGRSRRVIDPAHTLIFEFIILGGILPWLARRLPLSSRK